MNKHNILKAYYRIVMASVADTALNHHSLTTVLKDKSDKAEE